MLSSHRNLLVLMHWQSHCVDIIPYAFRHMLRNVPHSAEAETTLLLKYFLKFICYLLGIPWVCKDVFHSSIGHNISIAVSVQTRTAPA